MADYVAPYKPGADVTFAVTADITAGQLVELSAAKSVAPTSAATAAWIGVATTDAKTGDMVGVTSGGVQEVTASAAIAVGDVLIPAAAGKVAPIGAGTNYAQQVGVAVTAAAADGDLCWAKFTR